MTAAHEPIANPLLEAALAYTRRGFFVFPTHDVAQGECSCSKECSSPGKHPRTAHGVNDSTLDEATVRAWWDAWPQANVAIDCGRSDLTVVDVDVKNGAEGKATLKWVLERHADAFRGAELVASPTGGYHYYLAGATKTGAGTLGPGIDTRGVGGYVLAPPSRTFGRYDEHKRPVPGSQAAYELLRPAVALPRVPADLAQQPGAVALTAGFHLGDIAGQERTFDGAARAAIPYGEHRQALLWFSWHLRRVHGLTVDAAMGPLQSFLSSLDGYNPSNPFSERELRQMLTRLEPHVATGSPQVASNPFEGTITGLDAAQDERAFTWLWPYFFPLAEFVTLFGPGGVGKSTAFSWLSSVATQLGLNFGTVGVEEPFSRFVARSAAMGAVRSRLIGLSQPAIGLKFREHLEWIERFIVDKELQVLYFDSMRSHFELGKGEDSATNARNNLSGIADLAQRTGCLILGTFHTNKEDVYSGSTEMLNVPRIVIEAKEASQNKITLRVHKGNFKLPDYKLAFQREEIPYIGMNGMPMMQTFLEVGSMPRVEAQTLPIFRFLGNEPIGGGSLGEMAGNENEQHIRELLAVDPTMSGNAVFNIVGGNKSATFALVKRIKRDG